MTSMLRQAAIGAIAGLTLAAGITATVTPAAAQGWYGHGWHGAGWYGGGWGLRRGDWGGGWGWGWGWGGPVAAGVITGLAAGALAGSAYGTGYYGQCYVQNRPTFDDWGNFVGYVPVQVCY
jgi:hypothetical protein